MNKEEMDKLAAEAFSVDELEKCVNLGFDPVAVVAGDEEAIAKFLRFHAAAMGKNEPS